ncbi:DUF1206 domain-containing protein [Iamia sp. SCSIO 61187]|uniref:DUF1206 domain-containing protein n=1 Tax=Iamia sp. SCSIO 61187 TaxID=2722752 RepID=UPI001C6326C8|nr:DUF1206 domain-containing protein [Iamia sp. SCSIO 61187]QYG92715.1 DUF1206 domain-containing protein [Iamia sp. SCSIO 61187]
MDTHAPTADVGHPDWTEALARAGLVARGVVYTIFGLIAVRLAFLGSTDGEQASTTGAFSELVEKPLGSVLVGLTVAGLLAWGLSCAVAVVSGRNGSKPGASEPLDRVRDGVRGVVAVALAASGLRVLTQGEGSGGGSGQERELTARLMDAPAGQILVGVVGLVLLGLGIYHVVKAIRRDFLERVDLGRLGPSAPRHGLELLGVAGHVGRGLVFAVVGGFVLQAAVRHDPEESKGIDAALRELAGGGPGRALLIVIALGLVAFGVWCFVEARTRRSDV